MVTVQLLKSHKIPLPPPFPKGEKWNLPSAPQKLSSLSKREDGRDFWESLFKKR
jgi:hypothetical protein